MDQEYREKISQFTHAELVDTLVREAELRRQWEHKALGIKEDQCKETDETVRVQVVLEYGDGAKVSRRRTYDLDPRGFTMNERQQTENVPQHASVDDGAGEREIRKVGRPIVIVVGEIIGGSNEILFEEPPDELQCYIEKISDNCQFVFLWAGERIVLYEVTQTQLLYESFESHVDLMIDKVLRVTRDHKDFENSTNLSRAQVREALGRAASNHWGTEFERSFQLSTKSREG